MVLTPTIYNMSIQEKKTPPKATTPVTVGDRSSERFVDDLGNSGLTLEQPNRNSPSKIRITGDNDGIESSK